ncbi:MAG: DNA-binding transcriptional regulator [Bacteroidales bacterium]|jgi:LacI family transcriptional regulator|nr:DNA-binding transcriptional regulator [Bacteroidales bacterium]
MKKILLLTDFSSGYGRNLLQGIVKYSKEYGPWVFYRMPMYYRELYGDEGVIRWAKKWKADAVIAQLDSIDVTKLRQLRIPIIIQNYKERTNKMCNITGDYIRTGEMAADFFIHRGFTHFAYYGFSDMIWSRERAEGFRRIIEKRGFKLSVLNNNNRKDEHWSFNINTLSKWLLALPKPVALFACDDYFASHITETCKIHNIPVPDHISVLGVDNDVLICDTSAPPLSSIALDVESGGYKAAAVLHKLMSREISKAFDIVIPPRRIVLRQSTEKFATNDIDVMQVIAYIQRKYDKPLCVDDMMFLVPLSRRVLEKKFKREMGISIYQYLLYYRIEQYAHLLIATQRPLTELSLQCGFNDYKNVSRLFRKFKSINPMQYRKLYT